MRTYGFCLHLKMLSFLVLVLNHSSIRLMFKLYKFRTCYSNLVIIMFKFGLVWVPHKYPVGLFTAMAFLIAMISIMTYD